MAKTRNTTDARTKAKAKASSARRSHGKDRGAVAFRVPPPKAEMPRGYAQALAAIKQRIGQERLRVVMAANAAMVLLYWDVGRMILTRQEREGWGAKVIDRLSADLQEAYPDMRGLSPRNLKYMRAFAAAWPDRSFVQEPLAQIPWFHQIALLEKLSDPEQRVWYARKSALHGWSHNILAMQIASRAHERDGKAVTSFCFDTPTTSRPLACCCADRRTDWSSSTRSATQADRSAWRQTDVERSAQDENARRDRLQRYTTWTEEALREFQTALAAQRTVDPFLWGRGR